MAILSSYPRIADAFKQGQHNGLNFNYGNGVVRKDNVVTKVETGSIVLIDGAINYLECSDAGIVSCNQVSYTKGALPLFMVGVMSGEIVSISDDRCFFNLASGGGGGGGENNVGKLFEINFELINTGIIL